ncbi:MAG: isocitrate lyase/PEP mutase family protein, partial [Chloroflexota bacterium]|nr:isocitrate lyase/PEP mutase family protein [Chloroflexota bacterium]
RYRGILAGDKCVYPGSVFDPISARIAEDIGFEVGMFAGSIASGTVLGAPDLIVLTLTEFAQQIHRICRAGDLSLMVDADHGYGNALNVMRTVEELETAGVAALTIEDTVLPRTFGGGPDAVLPIDEGVGKMKAALAARTDPNMVVAGRTSSLRITDLADTIARVKAYEAVGVDAVFLAGASTRSEVEAVASEMKGPLLLVGTTGELADKDYLGSVGVRVALQGHLPFAAAIKATYDTLKALRDGVPPADLQSQLATSAQMDQFTRKADYAKWTTDFLS